MGQMMKDIGAIAVARIRTQMLARELELNKMMGAEMTKGIER